MNLNPKTPASQALALLKEVKSHYSRILERVAEQKEAIRHENEIRILELIEEKGISLKHAKRLEDEVEQIFNDLSGMEQEELALKTERIQKEIETLLKQVIAEEEACAKQLDEKKKKTGEKLKGIKHGKTVVKGYDSQKRSRSKISKNA